MTTRSFFLVAVGLAGCADDVMVTERPEPVCGRATLYEIDRMDLPMSSGDAVALGLDVDGDDRQTPDNVVGNIRGLLGSFGLSLTRSATPARAILLGVAECDGGVVRIHVGDGEPAEGTFDAAGVAARGGTGMFPARDLLRETPEGELDDVRGLAVSATFVGEELTGKIGFGIALEVANAVLAEAATTLLERDPGCPASCETDVGRTITTDIDLDPPDGLVTAEEFAASELGASLTLPDLDLVGPADENDHLSAGFGFHAVPLRKSP